MDILSIDIGSYSLKFLETRFERKQLSLINFHEIVLDKVRKQYKDGLTNEELQLEIIQEYLDGPYAGKVIAQIPNIHITSRYLDLPVTNRKKAEMMVPFQLDENLPYSINQAHFTTAMVKHPGKTEAIINITQREHFEQYFRKLQEKDILPAVLTSELSLVNCFVDYKNIQGPIAIVDIGHETTKAYVILNKRVISNHTSYLGGKNIDDVIASTYKIPMNEAIVYKHENCFLLTDNQYETVEKDQQEFAKLMKQTLWPLVLELKRWELGYRVKHGQALETIYLTGGSSSINNITNFLTQAVNIKFEHITELGILPRNSEALEDKELSFSTALLMAQAQKSKLPPANFLKGSFSSSFSQNIPIHSTAFIWTRLMVITLFLLATMSLEKMIFLTPELKSLNSTLKKRIKNSSLGLTSKEQRQFRNKPERILKILKKKNRAVEQEVKMVMAATSVNAVAPLVHLSQILSSNENINLIKFISADGEVQASFRGNTPEEVGTLATYLKSASLAGLKLDYQKGEKSLSMSYQEK
ncbi:MAG: pilus assembly protein PilM [Halobacteriovoraceae bacterium]|jgi:general secretion pathway protein L|nr:pilus assembly protein PilM [Halobacteriovoraceae bacterium]MBT5095334.1 pilus assembly protein PilM [Halobacteriovoraceae bacterium]